MITRKYKKIISLLFFFAALLSVNFVSAQVDIGSEYANNIGLGARNPKDIIVGIIQVVLGFLGLIAVILIMYGGFLWMTSNGDAAKVEKAKKTLIAAVIGLLIILSSWGIASWIINRFMEETGGVAVCDPVCDPASEKCCKGNFCCDTAEYCCSWGCSLTPCSSRPPGSDSFYVANTSPLDGAVNVIRNKTIRFTFSDRVASTTVNSANFRVADGAGNPIPGTLSVKGRTVEYHPDSACPANPCGAPFCLPANETIRVTAVGPGGLENINGIDLDCSAPNICTVSFTTGDSIDCKDPTVGLNFDQVCVSSASTIGAWAQDEDSGIDYVSFYVDGVWINNDPISEIPPNYDVVWDSSALMPGTRVWIRAEAYDEDDHSAADEQSATLRPEHCCNDVMDADETGVDCGGSCAACAGAACGASLADDCAADGIDCHATDDNCANRFCDCGGAAADCTDAGYEGGVSSCCLCENAPIILWASPQGGFCNNNPNIPCADNAPCAAADPADTCNRTTPNGAPGNLVTIGGRNFGTVPGTVSFSNGGGWVNAAPAGSVNPACDSSWTESQIVVVQPAGTDNRPVIRVTEASSGSAYSDTTGADGRGPVVEFQTNSIARPGLCEISPLAGIAGDSVSYQGINLSGVSAFFGNTAASVQAVGSNFPAATAGTAGVPGLRDGRTTTFAMTPADVESNYLLFTVGAIGGTGPAIVSFEPQGGKAGQYVTIYGRGFGIKKGKSKVCFGADCASGIEASYSFPDICRDSVWSDNQVIVKVPEGIANGNYLIAMEIEKLSAPIDTSELTPSRFTADSALPLLPSLCRIMPTMGPNNSPVYLWGEYFDSPNASSRVRFHLGHDRAWPAGIASWGPDSASKADKIETTVHELAVSGPVRAVKTDGAGNGLNFRVGECARSEDCGAGQTCCPDGSFNRHRCVINPDECYVAVPSSVFEWDFTTGSGGGGNTPDSCSGFTNANACIDQGMCPNSPGQCQTNAGLIGGDCGDNFCNNTYAFCQPGNLCSFNSASNRCELTSSTCDASRTFTLGGTDYSAQCRSVNGGGVWQFDNGGASCPLGSFINAFNNLCTVGSPASPAACSLCPANFTCNAAVCAIASPVCPSGTACNAASNKCVAAEPACECCCRVDTDTSAAPTQAEFNAQDCCAGLDCRPVGCGGAPAGCDPATDPSCQWGKCTGCRVELDGDRGTLTAQEIQASNDACNCAGKGNRYCEIDLGNPSDTGVCEDRTPCDLDPNTPVCEMDMNECAADEVCDPNTCYCEQREPCDADTATPNCEADDYLCDNSSYPFIENCNTDDCLCDLIRCDGNADSPACDASDDVCHEVNPQSYCDPDTCYCRASTTPPILGNLCIDPAATSPVCDLSVCSQPFQCMTESGPMNAYPDCGICCCDPTSSPDECQAVNQDLQCLADKGDCTGPDRGLCCGCKDDQTCGAVDIIGCGTDTCCYPRPNVSAVIPLDQSGDICRNALIWAVFDREMDLSSFSGNVLLVGDYGFGQCPDWTQYLALGDDFIEPKSTRFSLIDFLSDISNPFARPARAYFDIIAGHNFCAVPINVKAYSLPNGEGVVEIYPMHLMDGNANHYVILKGDQSLTDNRNIRSAEGVELRTTDTESFSSIQFANSYFWSFTTGPDACKLSSVTVSPSSYLLQTSADDVDVGNPFDPACEHDDIGDIVQGTAIDSTLHDCFNKLNDRDYVFNAKGRSVDGQELAPIPGIYEWSWSWSSDRPKVAEISALSVDPMFADVIAQNVKDDYTYIRASAKVTSDNIFTPSTVNSSVSGRARVQVFQCENPWPPKDPLTGLWMPWIDSGGIMGTVNPGNCTVQGDPSDPTCANNNFEMYYCRDDGRKGTADDLPSILIDSVIRSKTPDFLKEYFFFREPLPQASSGGLSVFDQGDGDRVLAEWSPIAGVVGYKLYFGGKADLLDDYVDMRLPPMVGGVLRKLVDGFENDETYYFAVTGYNDKGVESDFVPAGFPVKITDILPPQTPSILTYFMSDGKAQITWMLNDDDTEKYYVYYGQTSGVYASKKSVGSVNTVSISVANPSAPNYFAVSAMDASGNESPPSSEIVLFQP
jgi:hypothetical protein